MYSLALIIFVVSEKKAFEHFPIAIKSSEQNTYNFCVVSGIPDGISSRFLDLQFIMMSEQLQALGQV